MSGLSLSEHQQSTFYVAGFIPCVVTPIRDKEKNPMVSIDMQCFSGVREDSYEFAVSDCRRLVYINIKPCPVFTNSSWLETLDEKYDLERNLHLNPCDYLLGLILSFLGFHRTRERLLTCRSSIILLI